MDDYVRSEIDRPAEERGRERVVDDERYPRVMCYGRNGFYIEDIPERVSYRFGEYSLRFFRYRFPEILRIVGIDECRIYAEVPEVDIELRVRPAVKSARRYELVARLEYS
jgi:hypothetical protein